MEHNGEGLLKIGLFSRLTAISIRMLRYYQEKQVLMPASIDPFTGHRFYAVEQVMQAHWIRRLRDAGFAVNEIYEVMDSRSDPERLHLLMSARRSQLADERARLEAMNAAFDRISTFLKESTMDINVRQVHMPTMTVAALRRVVPTYHDEGQLWQELAALMEQAEITMPDHDRGIGGATFHDVEYRESDVDIEVWVQVNSPFNAALPLQCHEVPAQDVVVGTLTGSYEGMPEVSAALGSYIAANNLTTGSMFNIYRVSPAQSPDPSTWVTDVCFPIVRK